MIFRRTVTFIARLLGTLASCLTDVAIGGILVIFTTLAILSFDQTPGWYSVLFACAAAMTLLAASSALRFGSGTLLIRRPPLQRIAAALSLSAGVLITFSNMNVRYGGF